MTWIIVQNKNEFDGVWTAKQCQASYYKRMERHVQQVIEAGEGGSKLRESLSDRSVEKKLCY